MTTITFRTDSSEAERLFAILQAYGVADLQVDCGDEYLDISKEEIAEIELGLIEANKGLLVSDEEVQKEAQRLCM